MWGLGQLYTGGLSDRVGRKPLIVGGMITQAVALAWIAATASFWAWAAGAMLIGAGTAMVYPTLLAAIGVALPPTISSSRRDRTFIISPSVSARECGHHAFRLRRS